MIHSLDIQNFRGFRHLKVEGLGGVNLIIGHNDAGKTSLMAAAALMRDPQALTGVYFWVNRGRVGYSSDDADGSWSALFRNGDDQGGFAIEAAGAAQFLRRLSLRREDDTRGAGGTSLRFRLGGTSRDPFDLAFRPTPERLEAETAWPQEPRGFGSWGRNDSKSFQGAVTEFKKVLIAGKERAVIDAVATINPDVEDLTLIDGALWLRLKGSVRRMPASVLGDGARWLFDVAVGMADDDDDYCFFDEVENGLHHTTLRTLWRLLQQGRVDRQIFATTHSDECVRAACEVFRDAGDDRLRVVRIDRVGDEHRAVVYTRDDALYAIENGWEIRG